MKKFIIIFAALFMLSACEEQLAAVENIEMPEIAAPDAAPWIGRWTGPEGTYLDIVQTGDSFMISIADLDGPREFAGEAVDHGIKFNRDGVDETIREGSGEATGMKWLADKKNCLIVTQGEGYCRD